jgi:hypothetical protein
MASAVAGLSTASKRTGWRDACTVLNTVSALRGTLICFTS